jgi:peroxiredoxin
MEGCVMVNSKYHLPNRVLKCKALLWIAGFVFVAVPSTALIPSPDFAIKEPSGHTLLLSDFKGKVVVLEFLFVQSNHCIRVANMLNELNNEMSSRGFQAVGVVFDPPNVRDSEGRLIAPMVDYFKLTYPVGFATKEEVDNYLMRGNNQILNIPQIVVIDKAGNIRARSGAAGGDSTLEDKSSLRALVDNLLNEGATSKSARK